MPPFVEMKDIVKVYPNGVVANKHVNFECSWLVTCEIEIEFERDPKIGDLKFSGARVVGNIKLDLEDVSKLVIVRKKDLISSNFISVVVERHNSIEADSHQSESASEP